ncbi:HD domain-containing protein [Acidithiobacillus ferrooxidans]|uniref:HD domain-containing protein n=1 Tax=Acidithiobacillus ferrooxidans TaxID=920 RepID=UPI0021492295|nr:HD domain-containing protein [Acidithiobacillus ferrooxidans]MCR1345258.1 HD domain-containing protein [Acidithiobacillus ferrooxidans]MCR1354420.1 HD domain-containing protein [Acidithiobacillus ferrooxidans]
MTPTDRVPAKGISPDMTLNALLFAMERHKGQTRRGTDLPYITHPIAVSYLVAQFKRSKHLQELVAAAILHDVLEDTPTTFAELAEQFTPLVASLVLELTSDQAEIDRIGKREYLKAKMAGMSSYGLTIKLADRLHNISDRPTAKMVRDTLEILAHLQSHRRLTDPQKTLMERITTICEAKLAMAGEP